MPQTDEKPEKMKYSGIKTADADMPLLDKMSKRHREILRMDGEKMSAAEIAAALGVAIGTAKSRLHRARAALVALRKGAPA